MKHVKGITVAKAQAKDDGAEAMFFQIYFSVIAMMFSAALGGK